MTEDFSSNLDLLIDSNLLLLLAVGAFDLRLIRSFKRLSEFDLEDFYILRDFAKSYKIPATPHIYTEVINLANSLPAKIREPFLLYFATIIQSAKEILYPSEEICRTFEYQIFGLTDGAICAVPDSILILTQDGRLRDYMRRQGRKVIGLEDVRQARTKQSTEHS